MRGFVLLVMCCLVGASLGTALLSLDDAQGLLKKYVKNGLTSEERSSFNSLLQILSLPQYQSLQTQDPTRTRLLCILCQSVFGTAFELSREGESDEVLINTITNLCVSLGIQTESVCRGALALNIPILTYIVKNTPEAKPDQFCSFFFQNANDPTLCPLNDERFEWTVELPPAPTEPITTVIEDAQPLKIALITDAHIDPLYEAFSVAGCSEPTCCRKGQTRAKAPAYKPYIRDDIISKTVVHREGKILFDLNAVDDVNKAVEEARRESRARAVRSDESPAGFWGDYRSCDTPLWAYDDVIDRIYETHKDIDVIYYVGDSIDHFVWETTYDLIRSVNKHVVNKIRRTFGEQILVLPAIGNHESQPTNQFAPFRVTGEKLNTTWLYEELAEKWGNHLPDGAKESLSKRGEFSVLVRPGLRVISINSNIAYKNNWWLVYDPQDSKTHLDWLVSELYKAEQNGEKVHILSHIPPGVHDLIHTWTREYNRIVNRFSSTIAAEFTGHTHSDEFKIFYNDEGAPINVAFGLGGATTYSDYNLNYKIGEFDRNYAPVNILNYAYNLTEANLRPNQRPHWFLLYDMKNSFQLEDLSAKSISDLVYKMVSTDKHLLDLYSAFYSKLSDTRWQNCDTDCKLNNLCKTVVTVLWERDRCQQLNDLYYNDTIKV